MSDRSRKPRPSSQKLNRIYRNINLVQCGEDQTCAAGESEISAQLDASMVPNRVRRLHERVVRRALADVEGNWASQDITVSRMCDAWRLERLKARRRMREEEASNISDILKARLQVMEARSKTERERALRREEDRAGRQNLKLFSDMIWMIDNQNKARLDK